MIVAADNLTASRPSVRRALEQRDAGFISDLCARLAAAGADWLDVNPGFVPANQRAELWRFLIETTESACGLKLMLDSPQPEILDMAVGFCTRPPVLNMATAEEKRLGPVLDIAAHHNLEVVAAAMTATVPPDAEGRLALAALIASSAADRGIQGRQLILDPMVMPLALPHGEAHAAAVLECLRALPQVLDPPPARLIALSNLTTASAGSRAPFAAPPFLAAACGAGLEIAMLDALDLDLMKTVHLMKIFKGQGIFAPGDFA